MSVIARRLVGERDSPTWKEWAMHPELQIDYVNTFARVGERLRA